MILIDSIYINTSGGKILLDYLVASLEKSELSCYYLFDNRNKGDYSTIPDAKKKFIEASVRNRYNFYRSEGEKFTKVLCFGNIPPLIRLDIPVYTYFHQLLYVDLPDSITGLERLKFKLKISFLKFFKRNTDHFLVQSNSVKKKLLKALSLSSDTVIVMPFYPPLPSTTAIEKEKNTFLYVSTASPYKNHEKLINGFEAFYAEHQKGKLIVTVGEEFEAMRSLIASKQAAGIPIENLGIIPREELAYQYSRSEFLIYPSLRESFGLGLVEGIEHNCKVLGADLPYTFEVCEPSLVFDPHSASDISDTLGRAVSGTIGYSLKRINNEIDTLIKMLA